MHFATGGYFLDIGDAVFYPYAEVVFVIGKDTSHYHIPLLLSPFGYSTYRGS
jgi:5-hydroxyisourate hydrolase